MANALVQLRLDNATKEKAVAICEKLGIDLQTYLRICTTRLVQESGIPFSMKLDQDGKDEMKNALMETSRIAAEQGTQDMTLEEINAEIAAARRARKRDIS